MIECGECKMWIHAACEKLKNGSAQLWEKEDLAFKCAPCRGCEPGEGIELPKRYPKPPPPPVKADSLASSSHGPGLPSLRAVKTEADDGAPRRLSSTRIAGPKGPPENECQMCKGAFNKNNGPNVAKWIGDMDFVSHSACKKHCRTILIKKEYCPICKVSWRLKDGHETPFELIECGECKMWIHAACEKLEIGGRGHWNGHAFTCASCRGYEPGEGIEPPPRNKSLQPCAGCGTPEKDCGQLGLVPLLARPQSGEPEADEEVDAAALHCGECCDRYDNKEYCSICRKLWKDEDTDTFSCDKCEMWVHAECEKLPKVGSRMSD